MLKGLALASAGAGTTAYAVAFALGAAFLRQSTASPTCAILVAVGGPCCLVVGTILALRKDREAAALLWLGSAAAAIGFALGSGPHLARYFAALAILVGPQVLSASLLLAHARSAAKAPPPKRAGRR